MDPLTNSSIREGQAFSFYFQMEEAFDILASEEELQGALTAMSTLHLPYNIISYRPIPLTKWLGRLWKKELCEDLTFTLKLEGYWLKSRRGLEVSDPQPTCCPLSQSVKDALEQTVYDNVWRECLRFKLSNLVFKKENAGRSLETKLAAALTALEDWCDTNDMEVNLNKSYFLTFSLMHQALDLQLTHRGTQINTCNSFKYLGVTFARKV
ncbi:hypothetical protein CEXT_777591 [Caerostris extrusa]|uniref:Reverse transcriptase n=1 Tax=Caerostris extrusa TaxID=172846 RepID=A0AAV4UDB5_CAEEX|nr:hypothetical protein CEXT_777591 [Caerostris extrusa]